MDKKRRKHFVLYNTDDYMGYGTYYDEGNVQVYLKPDWTPLQMQLADALHLDGVKHFIWVDENPQKDRGVYEDGIMYYCDKCEYEGVTVPPFRHYPEYLDNEETDEEDDTDG